jgi:hypothetical protein
MWFEGDAIAVYCEKVNESLGFMKRLERLAGQIAATEKGRSPCQNSHQRAKQQTAFGVQKAAHIQ